MKEDIAKSIKVLNQGGVILYPSDTIWGIGCDAANMKAAQKIYKIKGRTEKSSFIVLLANPQKITDYVEVVPDILWDLLDSLDFPTTIIYPKAKNLAKNVMATDGSIAIRLVKEGFTYELLKEFNKPIVSTSANFTGTPAPFMYKEIAPELIEMIDYVVTVGRQSMQKLKPSTIIKLKPNGEFDIIRE
ncbi:MAG: threonylcarbamoyl-AMP synthase [Bacteroidales bacterium]|nr:threonylcarbamoyl-AMP synthase [Bacteroidales bacterium]MCF8405308.1 threonylcarbamoyl-AMP synthase [Bacteroidales bacterium]